MEDHSFYKYSPVIALWLVMIGTIIGLENLLVIYKELYERMNLTIRIGFIIFGNI